MSQSNINQTPWTKGLASSRKKYKGKLFKKLTKGLSKNGGRNNFGHLTSGKQGSGVIKESTE